LIRVKDYHILIALLFVAFFSVYFLPAILSRIIFLVILAAAYRTRLDYVYLVWFFIINDAPGRLFSAGEFSDARIPLYPIAAGISISFQELFLFLYILKLLQLKKFPTFLFKKEFAWFLVYGVAVAGYSMLLGMSFDNMVRAFRTLLPWSLVFIVPFYIHNRQILIRSSLMLFSVVFFAFAAQIFSYLTGTYPDHFLRGIDWRSLAVSEQSASRAYSAVYIILFSIIHGLYFFYNGKGEIKQNYLAAVIFFGFFSIFLTATRGWFIALSLLLFGVAVLFFNARQIRRWARLIGVSAVVFFIIFIQFPRLQQQVIGAVERISSLEALAQGDVTAQGTLKRIDVRIPRVMGKFWKSPFVGWGFSNEFYRYADGHVGHHNILLHVGILGFIFVNGLLLLLCIKMRKLAGQKDLRFKEGRSPLIFLLGLLAVVVIHSTSTQFWGYTLSMEKILFFAFFFAALNNVLLQSRHNGDNRAFKNQ